MHYATNLGESCLQLESSSVEVSFMLMYSKVKFSIRSITSLAAFFCNLCRMTPNLSSTVKKSTNFINDRIPLVLARLGCLEFRRPSVRNKVSMVINSHNTVLVKLQKNGRREYCMNTDVQE